jgi:DNA-binding transcriptional MerR regulator
MKYSIGQTSKIVGLRQSVLRFWESEFEQLAPEKTAGGTRKYSDEDINLIFKIKDLLYNQKFTIDGAKKQLELLKTANKKEITLNELIAIINELESILKELMSKTDK